jgi:hypothetical protein
MDDDTSVAKEGFIAGVSGEVEVEDDLLEGGRVVGNLAVLAAEVT